MKSLNLNLSEELCAGGGWGCAGAILGSVGLTLSAAAITVGTAGTGAVVAGFLVAKIGATFVIIDACYG
jgi:hypothetical protein